MERQQRRAQLCTGQNILKNVLTARALVCGLLQVVVREPGGRCHPGQSVPQSAGTLWKAFLPGGEIGLMTSIEGLLYGGLPTCRFVLKLGVDIYVFSGYSPEVLFS